MLLHAFVPASRANGPGLRAVVFQVPHIEEYLPLPGVAAYELLHGAQEKPFQFFLSAAFGQDGRVAFEAVPAGAVAHHVHRQYRRSRGQGQTRRPVRRNSGICR